MKQPADRSIVQRKYAEARTNLLIMIAFTVINIAIFVLGSDTMFLFSATVPYFAVIFGAEMGIPALFYVSIAFAAVIIIFYLLCWIFSKKHPSWMIPALIFFALDTAALLLLYIAAGDFSGIIDVAFHAFVLYYLITGVKYGKQLSKLPDELPEAPIENAEREIPATENSSPLRRDDEELKHRIFVETDCFGHHIRFQRTKRKNELVIDNYVYNEIELIIEGPHSLESRIDGHVIEAGYDGFSSYIKADGNIVVKKLRLF